MLLSAAAFRRPSAGVFAWAAVAMSCAPPKDAEAPLVPHPQGVAIDPVLSLPPAAASAEPSRGLAVLAEPVDPEPARRLVRRFLEAVVTESLPALTEVLDATAHSRTTGKPPRPEPALPWWRRRFERLDYTALAGEVFYRRSEMEAHTARDPEGSGKRVLAIQPKEGEIVVVVPVAGQTATKLFGPELTFLVRRASPPPGTGTRAGAADDPGPGLGRARMDQTYKIAELYEDFRLP